MLNKLLGFISPYSMYLKIGVFLLVALYIGYLNIQKGRFEGQLLTCKGKVAELQSSIQILADSVERQNASIYKLANDKKQLEKQHVEAIKKAQPILAHRDKQIIKATAPKNANLTCSDAVKLAKEALKGGK